MTNQSILYGDNKVCHGCGETKPFTIEFFGPRQGRPAGLTYACRLCLRIKAREAWRENRRSDGHKVRIGGRGPRTVVDGRKQCSKCNRSFPATIKFFRTREQGRLKSWCKSCCDANNKKTYRHGKGKEYHRQYQQTHKKERNIIGARTRARFRRRVIDKLGGKCSRCNASDIRCLQIDHRNGGGNQERKLCGCERTFHLKVLRDTTNSYDVLCANCNWIKRHELKEHGCPVKRLDHIGERQRRYGDNQRSKIRSDILSKLGTHCVRCGFNDSRALQVDHVRGDGSSERKRLNSRWKMYKDIMCDTTGKYQVLCANCQSVKRIEKREWRNQYSRPATSGT